MEDSRSFWERFGDTDFLPCPKCGGSQPHAVRRDQWNGVIEWACLRCGERGGKAPVTDGDDIGVGWDDCE